MLEDDDLTPDLMMINQEILEEASPIPKDLQILDPTIVNLN